MKKTPLLLLVTALIAWSTMTAQLAVNDDGSDPDSSAMLDVKSSNRGLLIPRMTTLEQIAINDPAVSLMVFNTDSLRIYFYDGTYWMSLQINLEDKIYGWYCGNELEYGGQYYSTVQIGSQCWMAENLNIGTRINEGVSQSGPEIQKYCYNNSDINCTTYGGLYQWNMMMQNSTDSIVQGICPDGWHIPTDYEWEVLESTLDTKYSLGHAEWAGGGFRGLDAGTYLKSPQGWGAGNGSELSKFIGKPAGLWNRSNFVHWSEYAAFWSSNENNSGTHAIDRYLGAESAKVGRDQWEKNYAFSVRCLKNKPTK